ncbi:MAG: CIA30 family protein [Cognaticolwellia sp.]
MRIITILLLLSISANSAAEGYEPQQNNLQNQQQLFAANSEVALMIDFSQQQSPDSWRITNDGVMGGKSSGEFVFQSNNALFKGDISLDNNGGFSSVFHSIEPLAKALDRVIIDIAGDGLTYQLRMVINHEGYRLSYKHDFNTVAKQRQTLSFTLADFQASFRGRILDNAPTLLAQDIREIGFLVTNKVAGPFELAIFSVKFDSK